MSALGAISHSTTLGTFFYIVFLVLIAYVSLLGVYYIVFACVGMIEGKRRAREDEDENRSLLLSSGFTVPVSIIIPAHNEEEWVAECVGSVLALRYPEYEVIVVDDGSTDKTIDVLNSLLRLEGYDKAYVPYYRSGRVREVFRSAKYPHATVICTASGNKKAGAINAALNIAKYKYICVIDSDTILEPDALLRVMAHVQRDPEHIIGVGSTFGLLNGFTIREGKVIDRNFSYSPLVAYQNLEYVRSFIGNRIGWSRFNVMPIVSGAFALWRRDIVHELRGFDKEYSSEDLEFTFRAHDYIAKSGKKDLKILMLPYLVGWTEGPGTVKALVQQRNRWQRVTNETIWRYRSMLFNPRYGGFAFLILPYYLFYEVFGVFFELVSMSMVALGWLLGVLSLKTFAAYFLLLALVQAFVSLLSIVAFVRGQKVFRVGYLVYLMALAVIELFWYRWLISYAKFTGTIAFLRKIRMQDQYVRTKHVAN